MTAETEALVALARKLEALASELGKHVGEDPKFRTLLEDFNGRLNAQCDAHLFRYLYQSQEPEELVETLLARREAAKAPAPPAPTDRPELVRLLRRLWTDPAIPHADVEHAEAALNRASRLPFSAFEEIGRCRDDVVAFVDFACDFQPITDRAALLTATRSYLEAREHESSAEAVLGPRVLAEAQARLDLPELRSLVRAWGLSGIVDDAAAVARLRRKLGMSAPPQEAPAPEPPTVVEAPAPAVERFTHAKFGTGTLVRREGSGAQTKLTLDFDGVERKLLARFVTPAL